MSRGFETGVLSPLGTARQRLDGASAPREGDGEGDGAAAGEYPVHLLAGLRDADLGPESLFLAWQIAAMAQTLTAGERRALTAIFVRALIGVAGGSTRTPVGPTERALLARATDVVGGRGERRPFILEGAYLYQQRLLACEDRLAGLLRDRRTGPPLVTDARADEALRGLAAAGAGAASAAAQPTAEQVAAVRTALVGRLTVITGGPGTGKTTIVLAILRALVRLGISPASVALAAPTGKAANRLEEAIKQGLQWLAPRAPEDDVLARDCPAAETLHRLLGWSPRAGTFAHHQNNRLAQRVVVVDESSMIDLALMERLARSVADDARLILLGDADQLPSIEAGAVFRDLTPLAQRLAHSHRVDSAEEGGRQLAELARAVREGSAPAIAPSPVAGVRFQGVELVLPEARDALLQRWYDEQVAFTPELTSMARHPFRTGADGRISAEDSARLARLQSHLHRARVLCVTRGRPTGTGAINQWLHLRHGAHRAPFVAGEPVMVLRNDYQRGLFNGDQGVTILLDDNDGRAARLGAAFPTRLGWEAWPVDGIGEALELSFAMTVHKSQGSELEVALVLLPEAPLPILTRELLYTAITRARRGALICGSAAVLAAAAAAPLVRSSGLADKLFGDGRGDGQVEGGQGSPGVSTRTS